MFTEGLTHLSSGADGGDRKTDSNKTSNCTKVKKNETVNIYHNIEFEQEKKVKEFVEINVYVFICVCMCVGTRIVNNV